MIPRSAQDDRDYFRRSRHDRRWVCIIGFVYAVEVELRRGLEEPFSPKRRGEFGFAGDVGGDGGGFVVPVHAMERLEAVAAEDADVAFDGLTVARFQTQF